MTVALPPMTTIQCVRLEGSSVQARNMVSSLRNWNLSGRVKYLRIELHIFDLPLPARDWEYLSSTFLHLCGARVHKLSLFTNGEPRWPKVVGYWLGWVSHGHETIDKGDMLLTLDLFI